MFLLRLVVASAMAFASVSAAPTATRAETFCDWIPGEPAFYMDEWDRANICIGCPYPCQEGTICRTGEDVHGRTLPNCTCDCQEIAETPPPPPEPPQDISRERKPLCSEAVLRGLAQPGQLGQATFDFSDLKDEFTEAIRRYEAAGDVPRANSGGPTEGMAGLMTWLANQGGIDTMIGSNAISKQFVFATDDDRAAWEKQRDRPPGSADEVRWGTERRLLAEMFRHQEANNGAKLTPGDVFFLALLQRRGNAKEAMLLAHNTLRSLARENDGVLTDVHYDLNAIENLFEPVVASETLGRGQNAGSLYHIFTMATMEMHARDNPALSEPMNFLYTAYADATREVYQQLARALSRDPNMELPETISLLSIWSNEAEQKYRSLKTNSPDDLDKWCYNIIGAQLGAWLHRILPATDGMPLLDPPPRDGAAVPAPREQALFSPAHVTWEGNGYRMRFDQKSGNFEGYYPLLIAPVYEPHSQTWGLRWIDLLGRPMTVTLEGTGAAHGHIVTLDHDMEHPARAIRIATLPLQPGARFRYQIGADQPPIAITDLQTGQQIAFRPSRSRDDGAQDLPAPDPVPGHDGFVFVGELFAGGVDNPDAVRNGPTVPVVLQTDKAYYVHRIRTYHWNDGRGSPPGTIAIQDQTGHIHGPWKAVGSSGQNGAPDVYWTIRPGIILHPGKYRLIDSEPATWATNEAAGNRGIFRIELQRVTPAPR